MKYEYHHSSWWYCWVEECLGFCTEAAALASQNKWLERCNGLTQTSTSTEKPHLCSDDKWEVKMDISKCHTIAPVFTRLSAVVTQSGF